MIEENKRRFKQNTANHTVNIRHDDGLYRHLVCSNNGSSVYRFDIVTYPGYLVVSGDMGEWIFERLPDMFEFFREPEGGINPGYWAEKCRAGKTREFSEDKFRDTVTEYVRNYFENDENGNFEKVLGAVQEDIFDLCDYGEAGEYAAYQLLDEFKCDFEDSVTSFRFVDTFELSFTEYTFHFLWALRGIVWAINEYDRINGAES